MNARAARAAEVLQMAQNFRQRAAETENSLYNSLMLRAALELEELADTIIRPNDSELVMIDDGEDDEVEDA